MPQWGALSRPGEAILGCGPPNSLKSSSQEGGCCPPPLLLNPAFATSTLLCLILCTLSLALLGSPPEESTYIHVLISGLAFRGIQTKALNMLDRKSVV